MENHEIAAVFEEISNLMKTLQDNPQWVFKDAAIPALYVPSVT